MTRKHLLFAVAAVTALAISQPAAAVDKTYYVDINAVFTSTCAQNSPTFPFTSFEQALYCIETCWTMSGPCVDYDWTIKVRPGELNPSGVLRAYPPQLIDSSHVGHTIKVRRWDDSGPKPIFRMVPPVPEFSSALRIVRPDVTVENVEVACEGCRGAFQDPPTLAPKDLKTSGVFFVGDAYEINHSVLRDSVVRGFDVGVELLCVGNEGVLVEGNSISENTVGVRIHHTKKTVRNNQIFGNDYGIIVACSDEGSLIKGNLISNNARSGIRLDQTNVPMCSGPELYQIKTTVRDNVIRGNGFGEGVQSVPETQGYHAGSGISMFVLDTENACRNDNPPDAEVKAKIFNNLIMENLNGLILTCGSSPVVENNLVIRNAHHGVVIDNDTTLSFDAAQLTGLEEPPPPYVGGACTDPLNPWAWSITPVPVCYVGTIDAIFNMNTIDGSEVPTSRDGIYMITKERQGLETRNEPVIENTTITSFGRWSVECSDGITNDPDYSWPNTWGSASGDYFNCPCQYPDDCLFKDPLYWEGDYPPEASHLHEANDFYLAHRGVYGALVSSPIRNLLPNTTNPWYQWLPLPPLFTIPNLAWADTEHGDDWDIGFHMIEGLWMSPGIE